MRDINKALTNLEGSIRKTVSSARRSVKSLGCVVFFSDPGVDEGISSGEGMAGPHQGIERSSKSASAGRSAEFESPTTSGLGSDNSGKLRILGDACRSRLPCDEPDGRELLELGYRMVKNLELKDRQWHWRIFKQCFPGDEAVQWMISDGVAKDITEAVELGNRMIEYGIFRHVTEGHSFENKPLFYRFTDAVMESGNCSTDSLPTKLMAIGEEVMHLEQRVAELHSQLKLHRQLNVALFESASEQQNRLESVSQAMSVQLSSIEMSVVLQSFLLAAVMLVVLGWCGKVMGLVVLCWAAMLSYKVWFPGCPTKAKNTGLAHGDLLQRLRDASNFPENPDACSANPPAKGIWFRGLSARLQLANEPATNEKSYRVGMDDQSENPTPVSASPYVMPNPEDYEGWPDRPCMLALNTSVSRQRATDGSNPHKIRVNTGEAFHFESKFFKGEAVLWVAGLETTPQGLFQGQKRKTHLAVQGRFKQELEFSEFLTGQEFSRPLKHLPATTLFSVLLRFAKKLSPSMIAGITPIPHILTPVVAGAQIITINKPGEENSINSPAQEDMRILGPELCKNNGESLPGPQRKKLMSDARHRKGRVFDTEHVYTFHFWQHLLDLSAFELDMSIKQFSLSRHLDGQPIQLMAKTKGGEYVWNFSMWHETLLGEQGVAAED